MTDQATSTRTRSASSVHDSMVAAYDSQRARLVPTDDAWGNLAGFFKLDPRRPLDDMLERVASFIESSDTLIDVGGGAGRMSLPLASRCKEVIIIDPSPGMASAFAATVKEAGIENATFLHSGWLEAGPVRGDVALIAHVTYFVPQIVPFIEKLNAATARRIIVAARSNPSPNQFAPFFKLAHGEDMALVPGPDQLLPVLDDLGIAVQTIDLGPAALPATMRVGQTKEEALQIELENARRTGGLQAGDEQQFVDAVSVRFDDLFVKTDRGLSRRTTVGVRDLLITWETR